ncbi:UNVERIFIED_CONTAM: hypothetical protein RMT77_012667 [Armadillidium vulgare]
MNNLFMLQYRLVFGLILLVVFSFTFFEFKSLGSNYSNCVRRIDEEDEEQNSQFEKFVNKYEREMSFRRDMAQKICLTYPEFLKVEKDFKSLFYEKNSHLAYCYHAKAGSETWLQIVLNLSQEKYQFESQAKHFAEKMFSNLLDEKSLNDDSALLINVVQHPFTRIMEGYLEKMIDDSTIDLKDSIIEKFRKPPKSTEKWTPLMRKAGIDNETTPTPQEYILNIISDFDNCTSNPDRMKCLSLLPSYWRPYHTECNPCAFNYSIISKIETFENDLAYIGSEVEKILGKENLPNKTEGQARFVLETLASAKKFIDEDSNILTLKFTKEVFELLSEYEKQLIARVYRFDFLLFDYDPFEIS